MLPIDRIRDLFAELVGWVSGVPTGAAANAEFEMEDTACRMWLD